MPSLARKISQLNTLIYLVDSRRIVGYNYDDDYIMGVPLRNRKGTTITEAWQNIRNKFKKASVAPETYVLDNELSKDLI